jgi:hypothetical protein
MKSVLFTSAAIVTAITFGCGVSGYSVYAVLLLALTGLFFSLRDLHAL